MEGVILGFYKDELKASQIYKRLAMKESDVKVKHQLEAFAKMEKRHAEFWKKLMESRGILPKEYKFRFAVLLYLLIRKVLGLRWTSRILELGENKAIREYYEYYKKGDLTEEEKEELKRIILDELAHEDFFKEEEQGIENNIRDIFLGMNDGLVEILSTVAGLTGLYMGKPRLVGISGLIVGLAGTLSMSIGTFISVKNQKDVKSFGIFRLRVLKELFNREGREEMEIENPLKSALFTGVFYLMGTAFIVYSFFIMKTAATALILSSLTAILVWIISGSIIALSSGLSVSKKVFEMIISGIGAAIITFGVGKVFSLL